MVAVTPKASSELWKQQRFLTKRSVSTLKTPTFAHGDEDDFQCSDSVGRSWEEQYLVSQASTRMMGAQWHLEEIGHQKWMNVSFWGAALLDKECKVSGADQAGAGRLQLTTHIPIHRYSTLTKQERNFWNLNQKIANWNSDQSLAQNVLYLDLVI